MSAAQMKQRHFVATGQVRVRSLATRMRWVVALSHTACRAAVWFALLMATQSLDRLGDFLLDALGHVTLFLRMGYFVNDVIRRHWWVWAACLIILSVVDLAARLQPRRGPLLGVVFRMWHLVSLWVPVVVATGFTIGLLEPLLRQKH